MTLQPISDYSNDRRIVLTLDAGGTNFVFTAIRGNEQMVEPLILPSCGDNLDNCLSVIDRGFREVKAKLSPLEPVAISFAFPGPADYPKGIIGDLSNLPSFRGGVPLGPIIGKNFGLPVFINNDGDLFAYGEAIAGFLPYVNKLLEDAGKPFRYHNLFGITVGTGLGGGIVSGGELFRGDNSMAAEVWLLRNRIDPSTNAEEGASIRAVKRVYAERSGVYENIPEPKDIYLIAKGKLPGNKTAAIEAFRQLGVVLGDVIAQALTLIDGVAVIGGGVAGAMEFIFPSLMQELRSTYVGYAGTSYPRLVQRIFNLDEEEERRMFLNQHCVTINIPGTDDIFHYMPTPSLAIGTSRIGTSKAICIGAYSYALKELDRMREDMSKG